MARARLLKPGFFQNEVLAELPYEGRLLFQGMWTLADREGRLEDRPKRIKASVFPFDDVAIDDLLAGLAERGFIVRYQVEAVAVIQITKFLEHQKPHRNEPGSKLPPESERTDETSTIGGSARAVCKSVTGVGDGRRDSPEPPAAASAPVFSYPCVGKAHEWDLTRKQADEWQQLFPNTDVLGECAKALAWVLASPNRRKTFTGMPKFLVGWLTRAVDTRTGDRRQQERRQGASYQPSAHDGYDGWKDRCRRDHGDTCGNFAAHQHRVQMDAQERASA